MNVEGPVSVMPFVSNAAVEAMIESIREQGAICPRSETAPDCLIMGGWVVNIRKALAKAIAAQMDPPSPAGKPAAKRPTDTVRKQPRKKP
jgi:hypothetical protein